MLRFLELNRNVLIRHSVNRDDIFSFLVDTVPNASIMESKMRVNIKPFDILAVLGIPRPYAVPRDRLLVKLKAKLLHFDGCLWVEFHGKIRNNCVLLSDEKLVYHSGRKQWNFKAIHQLPIAVKC